MCEYEHDYKNNCSLAMRLLLNIHLTESGLILPRLVPNHPKKMSVQILFTNLPSFLYPSPSVSLPHSYYACRHCFSQSSTNWHHAGPDKTILCQECRLYFQRYGCMMPITNKRQPPEFLYKDYHDATVGSEDNPSPPATAGLQTTPISGRKTRNSNGSRGGSLRPGLRSAKTNFLKSDTDDDDGENVKKFVLAK